MTTVLLSFAGSGLAQVEGGGSEMQTADLPVTRLVLFTNGVGYFEHEGVVSGDQALDLDVDPDKMDDLLQSLVLQDFDGGRIEPVRYDSRDPLGRILAGYSIDLSGAPTMAQILAQARGESVTLTASETVTGVIVSVERVEVPDAAARTFITLSGDDGLRRLDLAEVSDVSFDNPALTEELNQALAAIARHRAGESTAVRLTFSGEGERQVRIGYVREMPVWKSSYRLVIGADSGADLQGWAILDNPTDLDLVDVNVAFVAGQPISFVTELYDPIYVERLHVTPQASAGPAPKADVGALGVAARAALQAPSPAPTAQAGFADAVMESAAPSLAGAGVEAQATGVAGGATFAYQVSDPVSVGRHQSAMIPIVQQRVPAERLSLFDPRVLATNPLAGVRLQNDTGLHLAAGSVTVYDETGFAGTALMADLVPGDERILSFAVDLEVAVDVTGQSRPEEVVAVSLVNGLLEQSVRQRIDRIVRVAPRTDDERLIVIDLPRSDGYDVVSPTPSPLLTPDSWRFGVVINDGSTGGDGAQGSSAEAAPPEGGGGDAAADVPVQLRCLAVTPSSEGATADEPSGDASSAAGSCVLEVVLERVSSQTIALSNIDTSRIAFYLENVELDADTRRTLDEVLALKRELNRLTTAVSDREERIASIHEDQSRIRQNMNSLDRNSSLYRRYVADLETQEGQLDELELEAADLRDQRSSTQQQLDDLLRGLREG